MSTRVFTLTPQGAFALRESALFGFGQRMRPAGVGRQDPVFDGVMRLAFCLDGDLEIQVGVEVRQDDAGVHGVVHGGGELSAVRAQVARVLSLDHDARGYDAIADRDEVIAGLMRRAPGLRPPLFYSPYEAAIWAVLSARRPGWQMDRVRAALSAEHGAVFDLAGEQVAALPTPSTLLSLDGADRVEPARWARMQGIARAAADGLLAVDRLRAMGPDEAMRDVRRLDGIGPFYASLIVIRALGLTDVLPVDEKRALALAGELYELGAPATPAQLAALAENWRPWRTWCTVLLRAAGGRPAG